jgi:succinyl-CoA synthetase alpha subunit
VIAGGKGTAADKYAALEHARVRTVRSPAELGTAMAAALAGDHRRAKRKPKRAPAKPAARKRVPRPARRGARRR